MENIEPEIIPRLPEETDIEKEKRPVIEDIEGGLRIWEEEERKREGPEEKKPTLH